MVLSNVLEMHLISNTKIYYHNKIALPQISDYNRTSHFSSTLHLKTMTPDINSLHINKK